MKKITFLLFIFSSILLSAQNKEGDRAGTIFYSTVDKTETDFKLYVDLFEPERVTYIEAELYNDAEEKLSSVLVELKKEDKTYYVFNEEDNTKVKTIPQDINLTLKGTNQEVNYPKVKIKLLNANFLTIDFSQKIFY